MRDRIGTNNLANGAVRYGVYDAGGNRLRYEWIRPEDEPLEAGTPLNRETFLSAEAESVVWPASGKPANPTVNDAMDKLMEVKEVGDILTTVRVLSAPWHACDGSTFNQTAYQALYAVLGGTTLPTISYSSDTTTYIKMADD